MIISCDLNKSKIHENFSSVIINYMLNYHWLNLKWDDENINERLFYVNSVMSIVQKDYIMHVKRSNTIIPQKDDKKELGVYTETVDEGIVYKKFSNPIIHRDQVKNLIYEWNYNLLDFIGLFRENDYPMGE